MLRAYNEVVTRVPPRHRRPSPAVYRVARYRAADPDPRREIVLRRARGIGLAAAAMAGALALAACGGVARAPAAAAVVAAPRPGRQPQGRPGLRHRRPWRQVVQRRRRGRSRPGQDGASNIETKELSPAPARPRPTRRRGWSCWQGGYNPVIAVGFAYAGALEEGRAEVPRTSSSRSSTTRVVDAPNIAGLTLRRGAGLLPRRRRGGAEDQDGHVGFIGGCNVPLISQVRGRLRRRRQGGQPGHQGRRPSTSTQPPDCTGFNDPAKGKTAAEGMYDAGADIVYRPRAAPAPACSRPPRPTARHGHRRRLRPVPTPPTRR